MKKKKILHVIGSLNIGGAENMAMHIIRNVDRNRIKIDFLVFNEFNENSYEKEAKSLGAQIFRIDEPSCSYINFYWNLKRLFKNEKFDVIHSHTLFNNGIVLKIANEVGIKTRISHSHSTNSGRREKLTYRIYMKIMRYYINRYSTHLLACGIDAGRFLYRDKSLQKEIIIIKNGVNISEYEFNEVTRDSIRSELGFHDEFIIGHVGRMTKVKNHDFLLKVFYNVHKKNPSARLLIVGDGELRENIIEKIKKYKLEDYIILLGVRFDVSRLLQAMDILLLPSLYEGIPLVIIEAQASGLDCIISNKVSEETCITENIQRISLEDEKKWCKEIMKKKDIKKRKSNNQKLIDEGYDIKNSIKRIEKIYLTDNTS